MSPRRVVVGLALLGFTSLYREGVEIVLFLQTYRLQVGIRPEAWTLHPSGLPKRPPYVDGTVRHLELLGSETLVHVEINDHAHLVIARVDPVAGVGLRLGMPVCLDVAGGRVLMFDMQGRRVGDDTAVPLAPLAKAAHV